MNRDEHIPRAFDRDLESIQAPGLKWAGWSRRPSRRAPRRWRPATRTWPKQVRRRHKAIDAMEEQINEDAARAHRPARAHGDRPAHRDGGRSRSSASLERVGDYAKNMAKRPRCWPRCRAIDGAGHRALRRMATAVTGVQDALDALSAAMPGLADDVRQRDPVVDQMYNASSANC